MAGNRQRAVAATPASPCDRHTSTEVGASTDPTPLNRCSILTGYLYCVLIWPQCVSEGWSDKLKEQAEEGCNVAGKIRVNKVVGNIQLSPGRSFRTAAQNIYDLVPYLRDDKNRHDFTHTIHELSFESDQERNRERQREFRATLGIENPLDRTTKRVRAFTAVFLRFLMLSPNRLRNSSICSSTS